MISRILTYNMPLTLVELHVLQIILLGLMFTCLHSVHDTDNTWRSNEHSWIPSSILRPQLSSIHAYIWWTKRAGLTTDHVVSFWTIFGWIKRKLMKEAHHLLYDYGSGGCEGILIQGHAVKQRQIWLRFMKNSAWNEIATQCIIS